MFYAPPSIEAVTENRLDVEHALDLPVTRENLDSAASDLPVTREKNLDTSALVIRLTLLINSY